MKGLQRPANEQIHGEFHRKCGGSKDERTGERVSSEIALPLLATRSISAGARSAIAKNR
jgi:hypothetical protein